MITQIGISMIVPIFLGAFFGYQLDRWLGTGFFFLIFLLFGILAAFRNIYKLTKPFYAEDLKREQAELAYWDSLKKERSAAGQKGEAKSASLENTPTETAARASLDAEQEAAGTSAGQEFGVLERHRRAQLSAERMAEPKDSVWKTRREVAEEEFAAWRRERERNHDGGISHDGAVGYDSTDHGTGTICHDGTDGGTGTACRDSTDDRTGNGGA